MFMLWIPITNDLAQISAMKPIFVLEVELHKLMEFPLISAEQPKKQFDIRQTSYFPVLINMPPILLWDETLCKVII